MAIVSKKHVKGKLQQRHIAPAARACPTNVPTPQASCRRPKLPILRSDGEEKEMRKRGAGRRKRGDGRRKRGVREEKEGVREA